MIFTGLLFGIKSEEMIDVLSLNNRYVFLLFNFDDFEGRKIPVLCHYQISTLDCLLTKQARGITGNGSTWRLINKQEWFT